MRRAISSGYLYINFLRKTDLAAHAVLVDETLAISLLRTANDLPAVGAHDCTELRGEGSASQSVERFAHGLP